MSDSTELFCAVKAGVNTCEICYNEAYYRISRSSPLQVRSSRPAPQPRSLPVMELFRCGHGVCETCLERITARASFKCPFCRKGGATIANFDYVVSVSLEAYGLLASHENLPSPVKQINTFSEFMEEWENAYLSTHNKKHVFVSLHKQIVFNERERERKEQQIEMERKAAALKVEDKMRRVKSRNGAVCTICHKSTFTSAKQLEVHMNAKHTKHMTQRLPPSKC